MEVDTETYKDVLYVLLSFVQLSLILPLGSLWKENLFFFPPFQGCAVEFLILIAS